MSLNPNNLAIINRDYSLNVSSVLNKDHKQFGKSYLTDGNEETCWNSDEGNFQWILCTFHYPFILNELNIQFQGGFSCKKILIKYLNHKDQQELGESIIYCEDNNLTQNFKDINRLQFSSQFIKIFFLDCTDTFGRVIVYKFELYGQRSENKESQHD
ncbi:nuclear receptor 2C2-associated protein [Dermatophagoides pteronyssinus]|uniref:nuclear receptor 2C2-associated protein n=1 Tax=Dermatophagoides pteronyssinus TaxID=6956 RepID=UPI003F67C392